MIGVLNTVRGWRGTEVFLQYSLALAAALDYPSLLGFHDFLDHFPFLTRCFSCILLVYMKCIFCAF